MDAKTNILRAFARAAPFSTRPVLSPETNNPNAGPGSAVNGNKTGKRRSVTLD